MIIPDAHGDVAFYGLPYLEPALVKAEFGVEKAGHEAVLAAAMDRVRADLATRAPGTRSVVLAHAFVTGGEASDSERDITVGGVAAVPAGVFDGVDYAALGHLHGSQTITRRVRYSGSPLPYSFSEADHRKTMWLIDLDAEGGLTAERLDCPVPRELARIRGTLEDLLHDPELARHEEAWVEATLTDAVRPADPMARLAERFPHTLSLVFDPERSPTTTPTCPTPAASRAATTGRSPTTSWPMCAAPDPTRTNRPCSRRRSTRSARTPSYGR